MKKILLTSIVGLMALVPNMARADVNSVAGSLDIVPDALRKALVAHPRVDRSKFTKSLENLMETSGGSLTFDMIAQPCLDSVNSFEQKVDVCTAFITKLVEEQNEYVKDIEQGLESFISKTDRIKMDKSAVAFDAGRFVVAKMKFPFQLTQKRNLVLDKRNALFEDKKFVCVFGDNNSCAQLSGGTVYVFDDTQTDKYSKISTQAWTAGTPVGAQQLELDNQFQTVSGFDAGQNAAFASHNQNVAAFNESEAAKKDKPKFEKVEDPDLRETQWYKNCVSNAVDAYVSGAQYRYPDFTKDNVKVDSDKCKKSPCKVTLWTTKSNVGRQVVSCSE